MQICDQFSLCTFKTDKF